MFPVKRFILKGHSMEPTFREGDRVLINTFAYLFSKPKPGDIIAFQLPSQRDKILLKRIEGVIGDNQYFIAGFNKVDSQDSRHFGPIHHKQVLGKFLTSYKI
ncbi:MAG TPA: signal peptidase I [Candidatus Nanoarchaeia archaeon]